MTKGGWAGAGRGRLGRVCCDGGKWEAAGAGDKQVEHQGVGPGLPGQVRPPFLCGRESG